MAKEIEIPEYIYKTKGITKREWKNLKRKQLRDIIRAADDYRAGCYYCPDSRKLFDALDTMKESHSIKKWGR